jgi:hypothetical protein
MNGRPIFALVSSLALLFAAVSCQSAPKEPAPAPTESPEKARAKELVKGESSTASPKTAESPKASPAPAAAAGDTVSESDVSAGPTEAEIKFLESYLASLKYMVYFDESPKTAPNLVKTAIAQANRYLIEKMGVQPVDLESIEKKKADERAAFETETGGAMDYIQFIAQKLNADVYVELSLTVVGEANNGKYYSTVTGSAKLFNASTGELLGAIPLLSPKSVGNTQDAADTNAVSAAVWLIMPKMTEQAKGLLKTAWKDGIRYDIVLQGTPDAKAVALIKRQLGKKVRKVVQESFTAGETRWSVYTFKKGEAIEEYMYEAAAFAGMKDAYVLFQRGKSYVFNSGL